MSFASPESDNSKAPCTEPSDCSGALYTSAYPEIIDAPAGPTKGDPAPGLQGQKVPGEMQPQRAGDSFVPKAPHADGKQWTYLINLPTTFGGDNPANGGLTAFDRLQQLTRLTTNGHAQLFVQVTNPVTTEASMYRLTDGRLQSLGSVPDGSFKEGIQRLISMAPKDGKAAFIDESHGAGNDGLIKKENSLDPEDHLSLEDLSQAIRGGLNATGRAQLDLVSLDACNMSTPGVIGEMAGLTPNLVASEVQEFDPGQAVPETLQHALAHPLQDGKELGRLLVNESQKACRSFDARHTDRPCGTETLALYDTRKAPQFMAALSKFGDVLTSALDQPENRSALQHLIDNLPSSDGDGTEQLKDLRAFAEGVVQGINTGTVKDDPNHTLLNSAEAVSTAQARLIDQGFARSRPVQGQHGIATVLPDNRFDLPVLYDDGAGAVQQFNDNINEMVKSLDSQHKPTPEEVRNMLVQTAEDLTLSSWSDPRKPEDPQVSRTSSEESPTLADLAKQQGPIQIKDIELLRQAIIAAAAEPVISKTRLDDLSQLGAQTLLAVIEHRTQWLSQHVATGNALSRDLLDFQKAPNPGGWEKFLKKLTTEQ
jgi:hypothetical protein